MSGKIFCGQCRFKRSGIDHWGPDTCKQNQITKEDWNSRWQEGLKCEIKNKDNACPEFSPNIWFRIKRKILGSTP